MDINAIYHYIFSKINDDLAPYGFQRSGKSGLFYRYSANKKVGCAFEMQKSMFNSPECYSFTFNLGCIGLHNIRGYSGDKLTIKTLRYAFYDGTRLGHLTRGCDYWWEITDEILHDFPIEAYYDQFLHKDVIKAAEILIEQARQKESVYHQDE